MKEEPFCSRGRQGLKGCQKKAKYWMTKTSHILIREVRIRLFCKRTENPKSKRMIRIKGPLQWNWISKGPKGMLEWTGELKRIDECPEEISSWLITHPDTNVERVELKIFYDVKNNG